jgi:transposase
MAKHGREISSETKRNIFELIESGLRARDVAKRLTTCISKSTISRILKRWKQKGDFENAHRPGRPNATAGRADRTFCKGL